MSQHPKSFASRSAVRGVASGLLFLALFGTVWAWVGASGMQGWGYPWLRVATAIVGIILLAGGIRLLRASRPLSDETVGSEVERVQPLGRQFRIVLTIEVVAIVAAVAVCNLTGYPDLIVPIVALIVGVHFFPLAALFHVRAYYVTGVLLCLLVIITLLAVPPVVTLGARRILAWWSIVGLGQP